MPCQKQPICYLICGFPGAGKTTYAHGLSVETGAVCLNPDTACMRLFTPDQYERNWDACFAKTVDYLWVQAADYARRGQSVIFDMGFWTRQSRQEASYKARQIGFKVIVYYIDAPDAILKQRLSQRSGIIAARNLQNFENLRQQFEAPDVAQGETYIHIRNG